MVKSNELTKLCNWNEGRIKAVLYIKEQGAFVHKRGERIIVSKNSEDLLEVPIVQVENVSIIGNVQVSTQVLQMFMERGIDVSYFSYSGKYLGHTSAEASKNIFLRFEQYNYYMQEEKRLFMARKIVKNKIENQISFIQNYRWQGDDYDWKKDIAQMKKLQNSLEKEQTVNEILGIEGFCSNIYFGVYGKMFKGDFEFNGRNRRPPKDPINVILSLTYTMLTKEMCNMLDAESFESYLGFLHGIRYGRKSLALDMIEEFRQPIADRFVLLLFNKRMITAYEFEFPEDGSVVLNEDGFKKFCTEYERWMNGKNSASGENSFRKCMLQQVALLKKAIVKGEDYLPYNWSEKDVCNKL